MEIATSQLLPRIMRLALIGLATAFAWVVISLLFGFTAGHAHADDADDKGLSGAVTSVVDHTASAVTGTVSTAATGVTAVVNTVVEVVPAPVQQPVQEVVQTAGSVVNTVTQPVSEVVSSGVVSGITRPAVDLVAAVPVVGSVVSGVGLDDAVVDLGQTVDGTLTDLVTTVDETGTTIGQPPAAGPHPGLPNLPDLPAIPGLDDSDGTDTPATTGPLTVTDAAATRFSSAPAVRWAWGRASAIETAGSPAGTAIFASSATLAVAGGLGSAGGLCLPASASSGPGGAGPGAWALVALDPLAAHRAWVQRNGLEDEHAPPAPVGSTDVSPD